MPSTSTQRLAGLTTSVAVKAPVKAVAITNITLSGEQTVNGVACVAGDRVLVTEQTSAVNNGIYVVSTGPWTRAADFDGALDVVRGTLVVSNTGSTIYYRVTTSDPIAIGTSSIAFEEVGGAVTNSSVGLLLWPTSDAETAAGVTLMYYFYPWGDARRYGTVGDGVTDDSAALQAALDQMAETGGANVIIPPGSYFTGTQITVTAPQYQRCKVSGYGAEILTSGAISGLAVTGGSTTGGVTIEGLQVNHRGNADATAGFDLYATWNAKLVDCSVEAHDTATGYACYRLRNGTASDANTGCFWTLLDNCHVRRRAGGDGDAPDYGVLLRGAANATTIRCGNIGADIGVYVTNESGETYIANAVLIDGTAFEGFTTAIQFHADTSTSTFSGWRVVNCRAESGTTFVVLTGSTTQPAIPGWMSGNYLVSSVSTYLSNANSLYVNNFDFSVTPDYATNVRLRGRSQLEIAPLSSSSEHALGLWSSGAGYGVSLKSNTGAEVALLLWGTGTPEAAVTAPVGSLYFRTNGGASTTLYVKESGTGNTGWVAK